MIKGSKGKYLLRSKLTESTPEMTYLKEKYQYVLLLHTSVINDRNGAQSKFIKKSQSQKHEGHIHQCNLCEKSFMENNDPDAHVEDMPDVTKKENYQNVCICRDITVSDKCFNEDGYLYQDLKSVRKKKKKKKT